MSSKSVRVLAGGSFVVSTILSTGAAVFLVLAWDVPMRPNEFGTKGYAIVWSQVIGGVSAVLASRRPKNPIGWIFCGVRAREGMQIMTDRVAALGGTIAVESEPGRGTTVTGRVPARALEAVPG